MTTFEIVVTSMCIIVTESEKPNSEKSMVTHKIWDKVHSNSTVASKVLFLSFSDGRYPGLTFIDQAGKRVRIRVSTKNDKTLLHLELQPHNPTTFVQSYFQSLPAACNLATDT